MSPPRLQERREGGEKARGRELRENPTFERRLVRRVGVRLPSGLALLKTAEPIGLYPTLGPAPISRIGPIGRISHPIAEPGLSRTRAALCPFGRFALFAHTPFRRFASLAAVYRELLPDCRDQKAVLVANQMGPKITDAAHDLSLIPHGKRDFEINFIGTSPIRNIDHRHA